MNRIYSYSVLLHVKKNASTLAKTHFTTHARMAVRETNIALRSLYNDLLLWMPMLQKGDMDEEELFFLVAQKELNNIDRMTETGVTETAIADFKQALKETIVQSIVKKYAVRFPASELLTISNIVKEKHLGYYY